MKRTQPDFVYTENDFEQDFLKAYEKNHKIIAEATGVLLENQTDRPTLNVELQFASGNVMELQFARPKRPIYKQEAIPCQMLDVAKAGSRTGSKRTQAA